MFICCGSYFYYFSFFFFIILETNPPMLGTLTPPRPPLPQNTPKFWGVSTCPQCAFPRSHAPPSRKLGGTLLKTDCTTLGNKEP